MADEFKDVLFLKVDVDENSVSLFPVTVEQIRRVFGDN